MILNFSHFRRFFWLFGGKHTKNMTYPIKIYPSYGLKLPFSLSFYPLSQTTNFGLKNLSFYPIQKLLIPKKDILLSQNFILSFGISLCTVCRKLICNELPVHNLCGVTQRVSIHARSPYFASICPRNTAYTPD